MNKQEILSVLRIIKMSYPSFSKDMTKEQANDMIEVWSMMFAEDDARIVIEAVKSTVMKSKFPPSIAEVKDAIQVIQKGKNIASIEEEAWNKVNKAMSNSNYNSMSEFNKLDELTQRILGSHTVLKEYALIEDYKTKSFIKTDFVKSYRNMLSQKDEYSNLPSSAKKLSEELNCNEQFKLEDKEVARRSIEEK